MLTKYLTGADEQINKDLAAFILTVTTIHFITSVKKGIIVIYTP